MVQRNKTRHSLQNTVASNMSSLPALIILADPHARPLPTAALQQAGQEADARPDDLIHPELDAIQHLAQQGLKNKLDVMLVAPQTLLPKGLPVSSVTLPPSWERGLSSGDILIRGLSSAVLSTSNAAGWILIPADMPTLQSDTLMQMVHHVMHEEPVVHPEYRQQRGRPIGFSSEFFSELVRLRSERDFQRLLASYPSKAIEVSDAGIVMSIEAPKHPSLLIRPALPHPHAQGDRFKHLGQ